MIRSDNVSARPDMQPVKMKSRCIQNGILTFGKTCIPK